MNPYRLNVASRCGQGWRFAPLLPLFVFLAFPLKAQVGQTFPQRLPSRATTGVPDSPPDCNDPANSNLSECAALLGLPAAAAERLGRSPETPTRSRAPRGIPPGADDSTTAESPIRIPPPQYQEPEPPTEFQRYVKKSTGRMLPIFGASLFDGVPSTFAPVDRSSGESSACRGSRRRTGG